LRRGSFIGKVGFLWFVQGCIWRAAGKYALPDDAVGNFAVLACLDQSFDDLAVVSRPDKT
jgi:hypothetical protein